MTFEMFKKMFEYILYSLPIWILILAVAIYVFRKAIAYTMRSFFDKQMEKNLETFKNSLLKDLELLKIVKDKAEQQKVEAYNKIISTYGDYITGVKQLKVTPDLKKFHYDTGVKLFFYASDETIRAYLNLREYIDSKTIHTKDDKEVVRLYSEVMLSMRKDFGHIDTKCNSEDFTKLFIKD